MVLLILGIYHGLMQVLYRAGMIRSSQFLGLSYFQGLNAARCRKRDRVHHFLRRRLWLRDHSLLLRRPLNMKVAWLSFGLMIVGTLLAAAAILSGKATVLYTFYPPLRAHPAFYVGVVLLVIGSWIAFFNWLPPYFSWKREHRGEKVPLAVVGIFATFIIWLIATTPVAIEMIFLLIPWSMGWVATVNVPLARMLFWFFGHPLVYFWLRPGLRHVLHDAAEARRRKTVLRFRRAADFFVARALLGAGRNSSPVHRTRDQQHMEVRARVFYHARGCSEFSHGVHNRRVAGIRRARAGRSRPHRMVDKTSLPRQRSLVVLLSLCRPFHFYFWRSHRRHQRVVQPRQRRAQHLLVAGAFPPNRRRSDLSLLHRHEFVSGRNAHRQRRSSCRPGMFGCLTSGQSAS